MNMRLARYAGPMSRKTPALRSGSGFLSGRSRTPTVRWSLLLVAAGTVLTTGFASVTHPGPSSAPLDLPVSTAAAPHTAGARLPAEHATLQTGRQLLTPTPLDDDAPQEILTRHLTESGALGMAWTLVPFETRHSPLGTHHRFLYEAHGLPLLGHYAALHVNDEERAWYATHSVRAGLPRVDASETTGLASEGEAREWAVQAAPGEVVAARLGWFLENAAVRPVWQVDVVPPVDDEHGVRDLRLRFDARTGTLLSLEDRAVKHRPGTATVFPVSPAVSARDYELADVPGGVDSPHLNQYLVQVPLKGLSREPGKAGRLVGEYATVDGVAFSETYNFSYTRMRDEFQEVMAYHNTDRLQRFIQDLGFDDVNNESQRTRNANVYNPQPNAFYRPSEDVMFFHAHSGVMANGDAAEDAEVIIHENGHAIQHDQVPEWGGTYDQRSMGEGFSDFLAAAFLSKDSGGFGDSCTAEWFGSHTRGFPGVPLTGPVCMRNLANEYTYGEIGFDEIHKAGQVWGGLLWDLWHENSRDVAVTVALASHFLLDGSSTMPEAVDALIFADLELYQGAHARFIAEEAQRREIAGPWALFLLGAGPLPTPEVRIDPSLEAVYTVEAIPAEPADLSGWSRLQMHVGSKFQLVVPPFPYFEFENVTRLGVSSDGFLSPRGCPSPPIGVHDCPNSVIAGLWTTLDPDKCGEIRYKITSTHVRVAFHHVSYRESANEGGFGTIPQKAPNQLANEFCASLAGLDPLRPPGVLESPTVDFWIQVELATGTIEIALMAATGGDAAMTGIKSQDGTRVYQVRHSADALTEPQAWRFVRHVGPKVPVTYAVAGPFIPRAIPAGPWEPVNLANDAAVTVSIPTTRFYGRADVSEVAIASNGYIVPGGLADAECRGGAGLPSQIDCQDGLIAGLWTDLNPAFCGRVSHQVRDGWFRVAFDGVGYATGSPSQTVVCESALGALWPGGLISAAPLPRFATFWIGIELATGDIEVHLLRVDGGLPALTGIESPDGTSGHLVSSSLNALPPRAWRFIRQA